MVVDIVAILSVAISGMVSIISTIQNSRCETINCCGIQCHRKLKDDTNGGGGGSMESESMVSQTVFRES